MQGAVEVLDAVGAFDEGRLGEHVAAVDWMHREVAGGHRLPVGEARTIVAALRADMRAAGPRIPLARMDGTVAFHAVHAANVSVLAMATGALLRFDDDALARIGLAALLHDCGMWCLPPDLLAKDGALTEEDRRRIKEHPIVGARMILDADTALDLPAVVAYEHHVRQDGSGYPAFHYPRAPHYVSRLVQVCDVFQALRSARPFRKPWPTEFVLSFLRERSGFEFHPGIVQALIGLAEGGAAGTSGEGHPAED
jgi:HD-GYP domain-containing protein (c-di-GMP phosphodiesterase class II)